MFQGGCLILGRRDQLSDFPMFGMNGWAGKHDIFDRFLTEKCALLHGQTPRNGDGLISVEEFALMGLLQTKVHKETAW